MREVAAALALAAGPFAAPPRAVPVEVYNCYTATPDVRIEVDGRMLVLVPAAKRDDSVASCYSGTIAFRPSVHVRFIRGGTVRDFDLRLTRQTRVVAISARTLEAEAMDKDLLLD